jgi:hypothetical protein
MSLKKVLTSAGAVATALSLVFAGTTPASPAKVGRSVVLGSGDYAFTAAKMGFTRA